MMPPPMSDEARPTRILVVDDDPDVRALIEATLAQQGFEVQAFEDAREALEALGRFRPEVILSDLLMPNMDGWTFFQHVKRQPALRDVPFVFLTAVHSDSVVETSLDGGADDFLGKPFSPKTLVARIRAVLRRSRTPSATAPTGRLQGTVAGAGIVAVLQFLEANRLTARLAVASGQRRWEVVFEQGELLRVSGPASGEAPHPLREVLQLAEGSWVLETLARVPEP